MEDSLLSEEDEYALPRKMNLFSGKRNSVCPQDPSTNTNSFIPKRQDMGVSFSFSELSVQQEVGDCRNDHEESITLDIHANHENSQCSSLVIGNRPQHPSRNPSRNPHGNFVGIGNEGDSASFLNDQTSAVNFNDISLSEITDHTNSMNESAISTRNQNQDQDQDQNQNQNQNQIVNVDGMTYEEVLEWEQSQMSELDKRWMKIHDSVVEVGTPLTMHS